MRGNRVKFDPSRIVMRGGTGAHETMAFCLADPGEAFLGDNNTLRQSLKQSGHTIPSMRSSKVWTNGPTASLAASLQRGLQIIDYNQRNSPNGFNDAKAFDVILSFEVPISLIPQVHKQQTRNLFSKSVISPTIAIPLTSRRHHRSSGPDDMPAHIKSSLFGNTLITIPITNGKLNLGTWQGIWLCEHRDHGTPRNVVVTLNRI